MTADFKKPIPATGTIFSATAYFDAPGEAAKAEHVLRDAGYNTEIQAECCESIPMQIWRASSDCFDVCYPLMLDESYSEVERIITPLSGIIPLGADLFDASMIQDPADWQEELAEEDFGRGAKPTTTH
jgi:hypothetical protein